MTDSVPTTAITDPTELGDLLLEVLPPDFSTIENMSAGEGLDLIRKGRGHSGSIARAVGIEVAVDADRFQRNAYNSKL
ncbi:hypothetical protein SynWH8101_0551 [Synechococcus sp. WH 8101]|uniref:hypothetical protein n=1 Tax=Synechococcus sp. WH 8101 TaxID=59932 RepID=UPI001023939E|nr:hypothetical protein [Synechococcus sp. WH 8101]QBE68155.1 hypothetical protein SynWH8101_0551 [Synechococcus sp. WH 8101]QNI44362.1 hypothetical protein SynRCC2555_00560 [Synechococcus sp. WH 8101]